MLRIVSENVETPRMLAVCDNQRCGTYAQMAMPKDAVEEIVAAGFLQLLRKDGWGIGPFGAFCPFHSGHAKKSLIEVPTLNARRI